MTPPKLFTARLGPDGEPAIEAITSDATAPTSDKGRARRVVLNCDGLAGRSGSATQGRSRRKPERTAEE